MTIDPMMFWNIILSIVVLPIGWAFNKMFSEIKRLQILLNKTREEIAVNYVTKLDNKDIMKSVMERFDKLEEKIDKLMEK